MAGTENLSDEELEKAKAANIDFEAIEEATDEMIEVLRKHELNFREAVIGLHKLHGDVNESYVSELEIE